MRCTVNDCPNPVALREPVPLCASDAARVVIAYGQSQITQETSLRPARLPSPTGDKQVNKLLSLTRKRGSADSVGLPDALRITKASERTAYRRLETARKLWAEDQDGARP